MCVFRVRSARAEAEKGGRFLGGVVLLFFLGVVIRLIVAGADKGQGIWGKAVVVGKSEVDYLYEPYMEIGDSYQYLLLAKGLREKGKFSWDEDAVTFRLPGYPVFLALLGNNIRLVRLVQVLIAGLSGVLVGLIGKKLFGWQAGLIGAGLFTFDLSQIFYSGMVMSETVFVFLTVFGVFVFVQGQDWLSGLVLGIAAMTRPIGMLVFVPLVVYRLVHKPTNWRKMSLFLGLFFLFPGLWLIRNYRCFHRLGLTSNDGYNLVYTTAALVMADKEHISLDSARAMLAKRLMREANGDNPLALGARMRAMGQEVVLRAPGQFLKVYLKGVVTILLGVKADDLMMRITQPDPGRAGVSEFWERADKAQVGQGKRWVIFILSCGELLLLGVGLVSAVISFWQIPDRWWWFVFASLSLYFIFGSAPLADARFRMPAMPFIYLLAGAGFKVKASEMEKFR